MVAPACHPRARGVAGLRCQPVRDRSGTSLVGQAADLVEPLLVAAGDAVVLAEVLVPGGDDELLDDCPL